MKLTMTIESGNAAVVEDPEKAIERAMTDVLCRVRWGHKEGIIRDANGNTIGRWRTETEDGEWQRDQRAEDAGY